MRPVFRLQEDGILPRSSILFRFFFLCLKVVKAWALNSNLASILIRLALEPFWVGTTCSLKKKLSTYKTTELSLFGSWKKKWTFGRAIDAVHSSRNQTKGKIGFVTALAHAVFALKTAESRSRPPRCWYVYNYTTTTGDQNRSVFFRLTV